MSDFGFEFELDCFGTLKNLLLEQSEKGLAKSITGFFVLQLFPVMPHILHSEKYVVLGRVYPPSDVPDICTGSFFMSPCSPKKEESRVRPGMLLEYKTDEGSTVGLVLRLFTNLKDAAEFQEAEKKLPSLTLCTPRSFGELASIATEKTVSLRSKISSLKLLPMDSCAVKDPEVWRMFKNITSFMTPYLENGEFVDLLKSGGYNSKKDNLSQTLVRLAEYVEQNSVYKGAGLNDPLKRPDEVEKEEGENEEGEDGEVQVENERRLVEQSSTVPEFVFNIQGNNSPEQIQTPKKGTAAVVAGTFFEQAKKKRAKQQYQETTDILVQETRVLKTTTEHRKSVMLKKSAAKTATTIAEMPVILSSHPDVLQITDGFGVTQKSLKNMAMALISKRHPEKTDKEIKKLMIPSRAIVKLALLLHPALHDFDWAKRYPSNMDAASVRVHVIQFFSKKENKPMLRNCRIEYEDRRTLMDATRMGASTAAATEKRRKEGRKDTRNSKFIAEVNIAAPYFYKLE